MSKREDAPYFKCSRYDSCSVNNCPLDNVSRVTVGNDVEKSCKLSKTELEEVRASCKNRLLTTAQAKKVENLAKKECCNYSGGICDMSDKTCLQKSCKTLSCSWFVEAVLPLNVALETELTGNSTIKIAKTVKVETVSGKTKRCTICGRSFVPGNNRAKFCPKCQNVALKNRVKKCRSKTRSSVTFRRV